MSKSIIQDKSSGECYLCSLLLGIDSPAAYREEHHVMHGTANRRLSEHYGLKVYLCPYHHRISLRSAHNCYETDILLKQAAQRAFERKYSPEKWREVFAKNYLDTGNQESSRLAAGPQETFRAAAGPGESPRPAAGTEPAATCKNQQNKPFSQMNISQNIPSGFSFLEQDPGKEGL